jgi:16S rRNA (guanine527-N7)-methyltransferase
MNSRPDTAREIAELEQGMHELGIMFDITILERFEEYLQVLYAYHGRMHLLSHRDYERVSKRHFLPSLIALPYVEKHSRACDIGSGAGFPSIPLKILLPNLDLLILESQRKKADFLRHLINRLGLEGVEIVHERAENYSGSKFDIVLLRAVGAIKRFVKVLDILLEADGEAIFWKTFTIQEELKIAAGSLDKMHFTAEVKKIHTPIDKRPLALVILRKR